mmetsp:Transcript_2483/g.4626  ORF Transcript_2483/g.4626 Transcript_2483/m.4626 type:complete len:276 (-) Transcript_2483:1077-1904(-)
MCRILIHNRPGTIANLLSHKPAVIRPKRRNVSIVPVNNILKIKLILKRGRTLQRRIGLAREGNSEKRLALLVAIGRQIPPVRHIVHGHGGLPRVGIVLVLRLAIARAGVVEPDLGSVRVIAGCVAGHVHRGVVTLVVGQVAVGAEGLGDVRAVEKEVQVAVAHVLLVPPRAGGEGRIAGASDGHTLGVHGLPDGDLEVGIIHVLLLVVRALELDAAIHGHVGVGIAIVHAGTAADGVHGLKEVVHEGVVARVGVVVFVRVHDGDDERDVAGGGLA